MERTITGLPVGVPTAVWSPAATVEALIESLLARIWRISSVSAVVRVRCGRLASRSTWRITMSSAIERNAEYRVVCADRQLSIAPQGALT